MWWLPEPTGCTPKPRANSPRTSGLAARELCKLTPIADLSLALRDNQRTTLTPKGISFHYPEPLSIGEDSYETEATILRKGSVVIDGLDALIRHVNEHPHDCPFLATPKASASSTTSSPKPTKNSPHRKASTHEH